MKRVEPVLERLLPSLERITNNGGIEKVLKALNNE